MFLCSCIAFYIVFIYIKHTINCPHIYESVIWSTFFGFFNSQRFFWSVNHEQHIRLTAHIFNTVQSNRQFFAFFFQVHNFFFSIPFVSVVSFHFVELVQTRNWFVNSFPVCQHTAQPTVVYIKLTATTCAFFNNVLSLAFCSHKQNFTAVGSNIANSIQSIVKHRVSFLQIDNVNIIFFSVDKRSHLRIPATGMVTKVYAGFNHLAQSKSRKCHIYISFIFRLNLRRLRLLTAPERISFSFSACLRVKLQNRTIAASGLFLA